MVIIPTKFGVLRDRLVFFPNDRQLQELTRSLGWRDVIRVRQTTAAAPIPPVFDDVFRTNCIDLTQTSDSILMGMQPRARSYVRAAEKIKGVEIEINSAKAYTDFIEIYNRFATWKGHSGPISRRWLEHAKSVVDVFTIGLNGSSSVAHLFIRDSEIGRARGLYYASLRFENEELARLCRTLNRNLHWKEILFYRGKGFCCYDLGGIDEGDVGTNISQFKLSFGGRIVEEKTYYFAAGAGKLALRAMRTLPRLRSLLRGRFPT